MGTNVQFKKKGNHNTRHRAGVLSGTVLIEVVGLKTVFSFSPLCIYLSICCQGAAERCCGRKAASNLAASPTLREEKRKSTSHKKETDQSERSRPTDVALQHKITMFEGLVIDGLL